MVERYEPSDHAHRAPHFFRLLRGEEDAYSWLRAPFEHVLAFLVEARDDSVVLLEGHEQRRQRDRVIAAVFTKVNVGWQRKPGKPLNRTQPLDPRTTPSTLDKVEET